MSKSLSLGKLFRNPTGNFYLHFIGQNFSHIVTTCQEAGKYIISPHAQLKIGASTIRINNEYWSTISSLLPHFKMGDSWFPCRDALAVYQREEKQEVLSIAKQED